MISLHCSSSHLSPLLFSSCLYFLSPEDYTLFHHFIDQALMSDLPLSQCPQLVARQRGFPLPQLLCMSLFLFLTPEGFDCPLQQIPVLFAGRLRTRHLLLGLSLRPQQRQASQTISVLKTAIHKPSTSFLSVENLEAQETQM